MSLTFIMHSLLKLLQQQAIFVSASSWLDVKCLFNSLPFILYGASLELSKTFPFRFERSCPCWMHICKMGQWVQLYSLGFQGFQFLADLRKIIDCYCSYRILIQSLLLLVFSKLELKSETRVPRFYQMEPSSRYPLHCKWQWDLGLFHWFWCSVTWLNNFSKDTWFLVETISFQV